MSALPPEPPAEAVQQPDGSFVYLLPDGGGATLRYTRRGDGSWRRPEKVRPQRARPGGPGGPGAPQRAAGGGPGAGAAAAAAGGRAGAEDGPRTATAPPVYDALKDMLVALSTTEDRAFLLKIETELAAFVDGHCPQPPPPPRPPPPPPLPLA